MKKWTVQDRYGHNIYFTEERWQHILESRPELEPYFEQFLETLRTGRRKQRPTYSKRVSVLQTFRRTIAGKQQLGNHCSFQNVPQ